MTVEDFSERPGESERGSMDAHTGISRQWMYQALKVASIPDDEFAAMVESADTPAATGGARRNPVPIMTRTTATQAMAAAVDFMHSAYWGACDVEGRAIEPGTLGAPEGVLEGAYALALDVESVAAERGISWHEAREMVSQNP